MVSEMDPAQSRVVCAEFTPSLWTLLLQGTLGSWGSHNEAAAADNKREKPKRLPQQALAACLCCKKSQVMFGSPLWTLPRGT